MIQTVIKLQAKDQYLKLVSRPTLASGGIGVGKFEVEFSEHWEGYTDYFIIIAREDDAPDAEPRAYSMDENNSCTFPADEMARPGMVKVGLCGKLVTEEQNLIRTTTPVTVRISEGQIAEVVDPIPTRNIYQYLTKQYEELDVRVKALEDLLKDAEGGITIDLTNYYTKKETEKVIEDRIKKGINDGEFGGPDEIYVGDGDMPEGAVLQFELDGEDIDIPDGENCQCHDEIYVGDGEMPEDATIQIIVDETDESGDGDCVKSVNGITPDENGNVVVDVGGEGEWRLLKNDTLTEDVTHIYIASETPINEFMLRFWGRANTIDDTVNSGTVSCMCRPIFNNTIHASGIAGFPITTRQMNLFSYIHIKRENILLKATADGGAYGGFVSSTAVSHGTWYGNDIYNFNGVYMLLNNAADKYIKAGSVLEVWVR